MKKVYVLLNKPSTYDNTAKLIRAYESETAAQVMLETLTGIVRGTLEIVALDLEQAFDARVLFPERTPPYLPGVYQPSILTGRAELP